MQETQKLIEKLQNEGYRDVRVCPLPPLEGTGEHTHDEETVHIILSGELEINEGVDVKIYKAGDKIVFPSGTKHNAKANISGEMIVGVK